MIIIIIIIIMTYGRRGKYVSISKRTSLDNFVRSLGLLRTKFRTTLFEVRGYFVRSLEPLRKKFCYFIRNAYIRASQLRTKFGPTLNELCANFGPTSNEL